MPKDKDEYESVHEELVYYGSEVKALGDGKVAGYLTRYGTPKDVDLEGDFFSIHTDFGIIDGATLPVYYQHGFDGTMKARKLGHGTIKFDDVGLWLEAQLEMRDEYEKAIYELAEAGKLGWSSGAAGHLVERESVGKSNHIKSWPIAEASLTPCPAEPRNTAVPVKSLFIDLDGAADADDEALPVEEFNMDEETIAAMVAQAAEAAADKAVKAYAETMPKVTAGYDVSVVEDEADKALKGNPFKKGEFFKAIKDAALSPHSIDKRLLPLKATGLGEAVPSEGGFLVTQDIASGIMEKMWGVGSILSLINPLNVSGNGLVINTVDESSRADGSRMGGVRGYWLAEAADKTASKPKFSQVDLKLQKVAALCYATDELLEDSTALEGWINSNVPNELRFQVESAIVKGNGVGKPLGMLSAPALVSATRTDASEVDSLDVTRMWAARYPGVNDYVWLINSSVTVQLYNMSIGNFPVFLPQGSIAGSMYGQLMGRPVIENEYSPYLGTLGDIMLVSPSQYAFAQKSGGVQAASSIHVAFVSDETAFRFVYRCAGSPAWSSSVTAYDGTATISPFVALAATT